MNEDTKITLARYTIENVETYSNQSLAVVCSSLVRIDWNHKILLEIIKRQLAKRLNTTDASTSLTNMKPVHLTQFLVTFTHFENFDSEILTLIESVFVENIEQAEGLETAKMLIHHSKWARDTLKLDFEGVSKYSRKYARKERPSLNRTEKLYKKYNDSFTEKMIENVCFNIEKVDLKSIVEILSNFGTVNIQSNQTKRAIQKFATYSLHLFRKEETVNKNIDKTVLKNLLLKFYWDLKRF